MSQTSEKVLIIEPSHPAAETVGRERRRLFDFIRRRVSTREDAEDLLQDVMVQFVMNYSAVEPLERLSSWLFTVARNKIIDWYRRRKPDTMAGLFDKDGNELGEMVETIYDPAMSPDALLDRAIFWERLTEALAELPPPQREVFIRNEIDGLTFREISEETGQPLSTLLSRKRYAVQKLAELLMDYQPVSRDLSRK